MIIIGEKLNGSIPSVAQAIARRDADFIRERAAAQANAGADYIDVCASVQVDAEVETLQWMIRLVQEVTQVPLCIDSPNPEACMAAMAFCNRPGLINSVSMEGRKIDVVFPKIANTDWQCIALLCDDHGIPDSVERRLAVFEAILKRAEAFHIPPDRLYMDPLVVTLSTDPSALTTFSSCCRAIKARCPQVHVTSGLSNISYGLPARKNINQAFLVLAMQAGMDSAILDPTNENLMGSVYATNALLEKDESCGQYIAAFRQADPVESKKASRVQEVFHAVESGKAKEIAQLVADSLQQGVSPTAILNDGMIAAMSAIGERFSKGDAFIPEMLSAARTMKKGVEVLKPLLSSGQAGASGKVIIGTVAGDLHDIGKNLVSMMVESAGFQVVDLGADVSAERFLGAVSEHPDVKIVALSTLLTTTMPAMRDTVKALLAVPHRGFKILVGGAPVTQLFADQIGADGYSQDAASAAVKAKELTA